MEENTLACLKLPVVLPSHYSNMFKPLNSAIFLLNVMQYLQIFHITKICTT